VNIIIRRFRDISDHHSIFVGCRPAGHSYAVVVSRRRRSDIIAKRRQHHCLMQKQKQLLT
jgi:hypothetical protein